MKKLSLLALLFFSTIIDAKTIEVTSKIDEVTVMRTKAQIIRNKSVNIEKGENTLVFTNISNKLIPSSIQLKTEDGIMINSVTDNFIWGNYPTSKSYDKHPKIVKINKEIKSLNDSLDLIMAEFEVLEASKNFLKNNTTLNTKNGTNSLTELSKATDYFDKKNRELALKNIKLKNLKTDIEFKLKTKKDNRNSLRRKLNKDYKEIIVSLNSDISKTAKFELSYIVDNAYWTPSYDIKSKGIDEPIKIIYKAVVKQNTNEDWENVKIKLSSADAISSGKTPILRPYLLNYTKPKSVYADNIAEDRLKNSPLMLKSKSLSANSARGAKIEESKIDLQIKQNTSTVNFEVKKPYTILSNNEKYSINMNIIDLPATYQYNTIPVVDPRAYIIATLKNFQKYNFISGSANVYFENTFIGETTLEAKSFSDSLKISLGIDKSINIKRESVKDYTETKVFGNPITVFKSWKTTIKNNKPNKIKIMVLDQIPVSCHEDIEVEIINLSKGKLDEMGGGVRWILEVDKNQQKEVQIDYSVTHPNKQDLYIP